MTTKNLIDKISHDTRIPSTIVTTVIGNLIKSCTDSLCEGDRIVFDDLFIITTVNRKSRVVANNIAKTHHTIPARRSVKIKIDHKLKSALNSRRKDARTHKADSSMRAVSG